MTPECWRQVCSLFTAALRCTPSERDLLLREACAGHPELQAEVDRLLAGDVRADEDGFLRVPDAAQFHPGSGVRPFRGHLASGRCPQIAANPPPEIPGYETLSELEKSGVEKSGVSSSFRKNPVSVHHFGKSGVSSSFRKNDELTPDFPDENLSG